MSEVRTLENRVRRDQANAVEAKTVAQRQLTQPQVDNGPIGWTTGVTSSQLDRIVYSESRKKTLQAIVNQPYHVMAEVITEVEEQSGKVIKKEQLWYANEHSMINEVLNGNSSVVVLSWTHPGVQLVLSSRVGEHRSVKKQGYRLVGIKAIARARFDAVLPEVSGLYDPGGAVRPQERGESETGLKAVKLNMTREQVDAFVSRMDGLMVVTGAPGSGKTTVAFQRIRFLFDQQDERISNSILVPYSPERTKVFIGNPNLLNYSRHLLEDQLHIPTSVVSLIDSFVEGFIDKVWRYKHNARPRQQNLPLLEQRARTAFFGLVKSTDLGNLWHVYETQIAERLSQADQADWVVTSQKPSQVEPALSNLAHALKERTLGITSGREPLQSPLRMDALYRYVSSTYEHVRAGLEISVRQNFDDAFMRWLFWVYDPLTALEGFFTSQRSEGADRIRRGTGFRAKEAQVLDAIQEDWRSRQFGSEENPWLAWLLRFALPEVEDPQGRFREVPSTLVSAGCSDERWTHIVIDEAQDLSVAEASLLVSFVNPNGAVTVSADFRQVVSPVHGMVDADAIAIGNPLHNAEDRQLFPFARNMRQSKQIGQFLQAFHQAAFGELAQFDANETLDDVKPQLLLARPAEYPLRIKQLWSVLSRSKEVQSVALLQINEDEETLMRLRSALERIGVVLAPPWDAFAEDALITTSVERVKGLEFDACFILGLEDVERASLNFTLNRAYVALSRPARRLALLCEDFPALLQKIDTSLYDVRRF